MPQLLFYSPRGAAEGRRPGGSSVEVAESLIKIAPQKRELAAAETAALRPDLFLW